MELRHTNGYVNDAFVDQHLFTAEACPLETFRKHMLHHTLNSHSAPLGWRSTYFPRGIFPTHSTPPARVLLEYPVSFSRNQNGEPDRAITLQPSSSPAGMRALRPYLDDRAHARPALPRQSGASGLVPRGAAR